MTDAGLKQLEGLTELEMVSLHNTRVTDAGVEALEKSLPKARSITDLARGRSVFMPLRARCLRFAGRPGRLHRLHHFDQEHLEEMDTVVILDDHRSSFGIAGRILRMLDGERLPARELDHEGQKRTGGNHRPKLIGCGHSGGSPKSNNGPRLSLSTS